MSTGHLIQTIEISWFDSNLTSKFKWTQTMQMTKNEVLVNNWTRSINWTKKCWFVFCTHISNSVFFYRIHHHSRFYVGKKNGKFHSKNSVLCYIRLDAPYFMQIWWNLKVHKHRKWRCRNSWLMQTETKVVRAVSKDPTRCI